MRATRHLPSPFYRFTDQETRDDLPPIKLESEKFHPSIRLAHISMGIVKEPREMDDFCLMYFFASSGICQINAVEHPYTPRVLLVEPPFQPSSFEQDSTLSTRHISVHFDLRKGFPDRKPLYLGKPYSTKQHPFA